MDAFTEIINKTTTQIVNPLIVLLFVVALLVFFWGIFEFVAKASDDEGRVKGKDNILYGLIGMFIMVAVFGIIRIILGTFGLTSPF